VGAVISLVIIKAGIGMIVDTLNDILGKRENSEVTDQITKILCEEPKVHGAYDLVVYNFGPSKNLASVHLELPDTMTVKEVDALTRRVESRVMKETGVLLAGVGVYSYNTHDDKAKRIRDDIRKRLAAHPWVVQSHGFYLDEAKKAIRFDVVMSFDIKPEDGLREIYDEMRSAYPEYSFQITPDVDVSVSK
jgi:divalent metal cation (Fe/Co/Zn/Cd) transporter